MSGELWNFFDGEPFLDNPRIFLFNKRRRKSVRKKGQKTTMAKHHFRRRTKTNPRRHYRRNPRMRMMINRRRHHRPNPFFHFRHRRHRHFRRNPVSIAGLNLNQLLIGGAAVIISPMLEKQILPLLPTSITGTSYGPLLVKIAAGAGLWYAAKSTLGRSSSDVVAIALGAAIMADAAATFMPSLVSLSAYRPAGVRAYVPAGGLRLVRSGVVSGGRRGLRDTNGAASAVRAGISPMALSASGEVFAPPF